VELEGAAGADPELEAAVGEGAVGAEDLADGSGDRGELDEGFQREGPARAAEGGVGDGVGTGGRGADLEAAAAVRIEPDPEVGGGDAGGGRETGEAAACPEDAGGAWLRVGGVAEDGIAVEGDGGGGGRDRVGGDGFARGFVEMEEMHGIRIRAVGAGDRRLQGQGKEAKREQA
ncbi:Uncharacterized protein APZ42_001835, partial [Daphnia magna]